MSASPNSADSESQRRVTAGVALALLAIVLLAALSLYAVRELGNNFEETRRTEDVIGELRGVVTALSQAESSVRGYVLTGAPRSRTSWQVYSSRVREHLSAARELMADDPAHSARLLWLDSATTRRLQRMSQVVGAYERHGVDSALRQSQVTNAALSDSIVARIGVVEHTEVTHLADRANAAHENEGRAIGIIALSTTLTLLLLAFAGYAFMWDVRRRLATEARLRDALREAAEASEAKTRFLATVSHEIRTPLNAVVGMTELLLDTKLASEQVEFARTIHTNSESLSFLISDLLDLSKIEANQLDLESIPFDPGEIAESVGEILAVRAQLKGLDLVIDLSPDLPSLTEGDPNRFRQVLMNLVGNAIKFTERGEVVVTARIISCDENGVGLLEFRVRDTGIGISPEQQAVIFERFVQAERSTVRKFGGTGLGLTISRSIVELMNGDVSVESELGNGSTFSFRVPLKILAPPRLSQPEFKDSLAGADIVVVDPNETRREPTVRCLSACGARVKSVRTGEEAIRLLEEFDSRVVVIADETLPDMTGIEFIESLDRDKKIGSNVRAIMLCSLRAYMGATGKHGVLADCIYKPQRQARLIRGVRAALGHEEPVPVLADTGQWRTPASPGISPPKILLVEDQRDNWVLATRLLAGAGYEVDLAENGLIAVERAANFRYDLILMDIEMPVLDGFQATGAIRAGERDAHMLPVPIVALTAHAVEGYREKGIASGMDDYLTKPVKRNHLLEVCEKWIDKRPILLIADDSVENQVLLRNYLKEKPYRLVLVNNGLEAVNVFKHQRVSLVILDMDMPVMDGYDAARAIRRLPGGGLVPIIAATGYEGTEERMRCAAAGCTGYLSKPLRRNEVAETIAKMLGASAPASMPRADAVAAADAVAGFAEPETAAALEVIRRKRRQITSLRRLALQGEHQSLLLEIEEAYTVACNLDLRELRVAAEELNEAVHRNDSDPIHLWIDRLNEALRSAERILVVRDSGLLDSPPEEVYDRLVRLASTILRVPTAMITVVDQDRQFFKSAIGAKEPFASQRGTPISHSFCQHVAASGEPLVVENARLHPLVKDNPAIDEMGVVAYAGMPLLTEDGVALGSFCVIDSKPRYWSPDDLSMLGDLAALALSEWKAGRSRNRHSQDS